MSFSSTDERLSLASLRERLRFELDSLIEWMVKNEKLEASSCQYLQLQSLGGCIKRVAQT